MQTEYHREDEWWVSKYSARPEATREFELPKDVAIHDATLRDGEQTPGVVMTVDDKIAIAEMLDEVGVDRIEAGLPAVSEADFAAIKAITSRGLKAKIFTLARAMREDVDRALACGADGIVVEVPIGRPKLQYQFGWTWEDVLRKSVDVIGYARDRGLHVNYFPYDTTRADEEDLDNLLTRLVEAAPPSSIGIVDTMGCALPGAIKYLVRHVHQLTGLPIEVHTHNDFGMAVATELAGLEAGASVLHSCVNGLGERTGNAATEELIMALHVLYGYEGKYDLKRLVELGDLVSRVTGLPIAHNKPVLGRLNYTRESGMGVDLTVRRPLAMFAVAPAVTGRTGAIVLGKKSGKASISYNLDQLGLAASDAEMAEMLARVKRLGIAERRLVSPDEFEAIARAVLGASAGEPAGSPTGSLAGIAA